MNIPIETLPYLVAAMATLSGAVSFLAVYVKKLIAAHTRELKEQQRAHSDELDKERAAHGSELRRLHDAVHERDEETRRLNDQRVDETKAQVDRVLAYKQEFDDLASKLTAFVEAVAAVREVKGLPGRRSDR